MKIRHILLGLFILIAFGMGYALGSHRLYECQKHNEALFNDLTYAVGRGVWLEAHLTRCKEGDK